MQFDLENNLFLQQIKMKVHVVYLTFINNNNFTSAVRGENQDHQRTKLFSVLFWHYVRERVDWCLQFVDAFGNSIAAPSVFICRIMHKPHIHFLSCKGLWEWLQSSLLIVPVRPPLLGLMRCIIIVIIRAVTLHDMEQDDPEGCSHLSDCWKPRVGRHVDFEEETNKLRGFLFEISVMDFVSNDWLLRNINSVHRRTLLGATTTLYVCFFRETFCLLSSPFASLFLSHRFPILYLSDSVRLYLYLRALVRKVNWIYWVSYKAGSVLSS